jgi:hypothetical protein
MANDEKIRVLRAVIASLESSNAEAAKRGLVSLVDGIDIVDTLRAIADGAPEFHPSAALFLARDEAARFARAWFQVTPGIEWSTP